MDGAGANMCKAVNIDGVAVKASFISRVCVGGKNNILCLDLLMDYQKWSINKKGIILAEICKQSKFICKKKY